jgi:hypothetical protein
MIYDWSWRLKCVGNQNCQLGESFLDNNLYKFKRNLSTFKLTMNSAPRKKGKRIQESWIGNLWNV